MNLGRLAQGLPSLVPIHPTGGMEILRRYDIPVAGRKAVVVGRSNVVREAACSIVVTRTCDGHDLPFAHSRPA
jgi:methylenetetrahydrofolate dehydrogenase (NADP+)/methenyltetrahydrofolate cyclohydrolase